MKKRSFLLLEVLIAFTLVAICAIPLVKQPLKLYKTELEALMKMEQQRLADWTFTEIKELLLKNEIPWEKIPTENIKTSPFSLPPTTIQIPGYEPKTIERKFILRGLGEKRGNELYRKIQVQVTLNQDTYLFCLPIKFVEEKSGSRHSGN